MKSFIKLNPTCFILFSRLIIWKNWLLDHHVLCKTCLMFSLPDYININIYTSFFYFIHYLLWIRSKVITIKIFLPDWKSWTTIKLHFFTCYIFVMQTISIFVTFLFSAYILMLIIMLIWSLCCHRLDSLWTQFKYNFEHKFSSCL